MASLSFRYSDVLVGCGVLVSIVFIYYFGRDGKLPPGPKGFPVIGNWLQLPREREWQTYNRWAEQHGDIVHVKDFHRDVIILNSFKTAYELLEKRSNVYSGRPQFVMFHELMGFGGSTAFLPYGNIWRKHRTLYNQQLHSGAISQFYPLQIAASRRLLRILLDSPAKFRQHFRHLSASIIMDFTYGHDILPENDPLVTLLESTSKAFIKSIRPGAYIVDNFPILKHIPTWFPGAGFKKFAQETKERIFYARMVPFRNVKSQLKAGVARPSFVANSLSELGKDDESDADIDAVKLVAGGILGAGTDTTANTLVVFVLAMALHPECIKKVQAELDAVVGQDRLPEFSDRQNLPYLDAVLKEVLRWFPVVPAALPHATVAEDFYEGYRIPSGSIVIPNTWRFMHDPEIYSEPNIFNPERFLPNKSNGVGEKDPVSTGCFGFGRRICAGKNLADSTVWITMASLLAAFDISNPRDSQGKEFTPEQVLSPPPGPAGRPQIFSVDIIPRSKEIESLIKLVDVY